MQYKDVEPFKLLSYKNYKVIILTKNDDNFSCITDDSSNPIYINTGMKPETWFNENSVFTKLSYYNIKEYDSKLLRKFMRFIFNG